MIIPIVSYSVTVLSFLLSIKAYKFVQKWVCIGQFYVYNLAEITVSIYGKEMNF